MCDTPFDRSFFSALIRYMTCHAICRQKARIKSKTSVAQTASQVAVYAKGLTTQPQAVCSPRSGGSVQSQLLQHAVRQAGKNVRAAGRRVAAHTAATVHRRHHLLLQIHNRPITTSAD
jgi:hypothetical protein